MPRNVERNCERNTRTLRSANVLSEPLPRGHRPLDSRIVLKVKYRANGAFDKLKARLVASGFLAKIGIDFFSTFSPMASMRAVRNSGTRPSQNSSGQDAV